jgi:single-stranded-DNA-specific exonuclease
VATASGRTTSRGSSTSTPDAKAVITCDTGIDSHAGIDHGVRAGLTMMITDHHLEIERPSAGTNYLAAHVVIDPVKIGETYKHGRICGAHVLYQVLVSYATAHDRDKLDEISLLRLFAGIGTVSDVMPVLWENRRLVSDSLAVARLLHVQPDKDTEGNPVMPDVSQSTLMLLLSHRPHHPRYVAAFDGMARVIAHFAVAGKIRDVDSIDEGFYGFYLAPAFNAIRRMGTPMEEAFGAFFADPAGKDARIASIIATNDRRKELVKELFSGMMERDQPFAPHVYLVDAVKGMLGLLANKVMEHNGGIPSVVLGDHGDHSLPYSGSARAPGWYAFNSALNAAGFHSAGHEQAFGTKVADYADIARLRDFIETDVAAVRAAMMASPDYVEPSPDLLLGSFPNCDADFYDVEEMVELALRIESFAPFGHDFKEPVVEVMVDVADCRLDLIGEKKNHLRVALPSGIKCLLWDSEALYYDLVDAKDEPLDADRVLHMAGKLRTNTYMGNTTANFMMDAIAIGSR